MTARPNGERGGRGGPVENRFPEVTGTKQVDPKAGGSTSAKPRPPKPSK